MEKTQGVNKHTNLYQYGVEKGTWTIENQIALMVMFDARKRRETVFQCQLMQKYFLKKLQLEDWVNGLVQS